MPPSKPVLAMIEYFAQHYCKPLNLAVYYFREPIITLGSRPALRDTERIRRSRPTVHDITRAPTVLSARPYETRLADLAAGF